MTVSTLFNVDSHMQLYADANISTPEIIFFNLVSVNTLREGNQTAASIKPDDEDGWFMLWGCLSIGAVLSTVAVAQHTYRYFNNPHRRNSHVAGQHCLVDEMMEETKEASPDLTILNL